MTAEGTPKPCTQHPGWENHCNSGACGACWLCAYQAVGAPESRAAAGLPVELVRWWRERNGAFHAGEMRMALDALEAAKACEQALIVAVRGAEARESRAVEYSDRLTTTVIERDGEIKALQARIDAARWRERQLIDELEAHGLTPPPARAALTGEGAEQHG